MIIRYHKVLNYHKKNPTEALDSDLENYLFEIFFISSARSSKE